MKKKALMRLVLAGCLGFGALLHLQAESPWAFDIDPRLLGVDVGVGYRGLALLPDVQTTFWLYLGGGYEGQHYYRDTTGGLLSPGEIGASGSLPNADPSFNRIEGAWRLGIEQGFVWNDRTDTNLLEAFFFYRGRYDLNQAAGGSLLAIAPLDILPDRDELILNTLQMGLGYDDLLFQKKHKTKDGIAAELTAEWGPAFLFNTVKGDSDFIRFNGTFQWFLPLYDLAPDQPANLLSVYLGEYFSIDYAIGLNGSRVPLYIRQTFGGRNQLTGLGDSVRGVDKGGYDTNFKAFNSIELRANLPAIFLPDLVPGMVAFLDMGVYDQVGEPGISSPSPGFVAGTGVGVYIDVLDLGSLAAYVEYRLDAANAEGDRLRVFVIEFGMHF
jgi:outer membrane protein assembly factor BamA